MANKAWTQQEILDHLQSLQPKPSFTLRRFLLGGDECVDFPSSLEQAARLIANIQEIYELEIEHIKYGDFLDNDGFLNQNEVQVTSSKSQ